MRILNLFLVFILVAGIGCDSRPAKKKVIIDAQEIAERKPLIEPLKGLSENTKEFSPLYVYDDKGSRQNHFVPSGFMPNGKCLKLNDRMTEGCQSGKTCIQIIYDIQCSMEDQNWSGIYWLNPPNNWGTRRGGFDLAGATKITFWAKGQKGGERIEEFKIGGISGDYPDSDMAMIGPVILTDQWRQYSIALKGKDLSYISGGFSWATNTDVNPEDCTFYLDNIRYE